MEFPLLFCSLYTCHRLQSGNPHVHVKINNQSEVSLLVHTERPLPTANTAVSQNSSLVRSVTRDIPVDSMYLLSLLSHSIFFYPLIFSLSPSDLIQLFSY